MNSRRELIPNIVLGVALLCALIFAGAWLVQGGRTSVGGYIALVLAVVALIVYVFLRPTEIKDAVTSRQARYGGNTLLMTVIFVAILALVNFLSMKQFKRWDNRPSRFCISLRAATRLDRTPSSCSTSTALTLTSSRCRWLTPTRNRRWRDSIWPTTECWSCWRATSM
jgi:F0F1-type ATP synthase assembly protein I